MPVLGPDGEVNPNLVGRAAAVDIKTKRGRVLVEAGAAGAGADEAGAVGQDPIDPVGPIEQAAPRVDQCPQIADESGKNRQPDPPDDPHQGRRDVAIGILASAKSGGHGQDE